MSSASSTLASSGWGQSKSETIGTCGGSKDGGGPQPVVDQLVDLHYSAHVWDGSASNGMDRGVGVIKSEGNQE